MRMVYLSNEKEIQEFVLRAAKKFEDSKVYTYTDGEIEAGCLFAMRYGLDNDCVVVFKLDEYLEPVNYQNLIKKVEGPSSKEEGKLHKRIKELEKKIEVVYGAGMDGISHVARANYASREQAATDALDIAMYGEE